MRKLLMAAGAFTLAAGTLGSVTNAYAADHLDAPAVKTDGRTDINDVYAFRSPTDHAKTVLIMTVNPLAGTQNGTTFHPDAKYQFVVDNDGDAESDGYKLDEYRPNAWRSCDKAADGLWRSEQPRPEHWNRRPGRERRHRGRSSW